MPQSFGQLALPPLHPVGVPNFTIPFEVSESASSLGEVEMLVSKDRGRSWHTVARQPVVSGKFPFQADADGEYWFAFRRVSATGNVAPFTGHPQLRVLVNTTEPVILPPAQPSESGAIIPPRPERFRPEKNTPMQPIQTTQAEKTKEQESVESAPPESIVCEEDIIPERTVADEPVKESRQAFGPKLPGFDIAEARRNHDSELLEDLLSGMRPFMDVQPVVVRRTVLNTLVASNVASAVPSPVADTPPVSVPAGGITGIKLDSTDARPRQHIVVQWNTGHESWRDAQIDILRSNTKEGPWIPIAMNLSNSGEYWWFLTPEDLKPFYVAVRIRSHTSGIYLGVTQEAIKIDSKLASF